MNVLVEKPGFSLSDQADCSFEVSWEAKRMSRQLKTWFLNGE